MNELQKSIEEITYENKIFPRKALENIIANKKVAIPYLRSAIEKALEERDELEEGYQLHFYALFLLGEFQDRDSFEKIMELATLPQELLDYLIGDVVTSGLKDVLYNTYNGDINLVKNTIMNEYVNEFVRAGLLEVMAQLYCDGILEEKEWRDFIKENVYDGESYSYFYDALASVICQCHFVDMLPDIRYMLQNGLMDEMCLGKYDSCVDYMFDYEYHVREFCDSPINTIDTLKTWAMFEENDNWEDNEESRKEFEKLIKAAIKKKTEQAPVRKVGRNDPCPCGSGVKYKFCCLNKPSSPMDSIESVQERNKCLERYPYVGENRQADRVYLEDYFDADSIQIDKILYLGLKHREGLIWLRDEKKEENRCKEYLSLAFQLFMEKVKREDIKTFEEYDKKFSIHYFCNEWFEKLMNLLIEYGEVNLYRDVKRCWKAMRT